MTRTLLTVLAAGLAFSAHAREFTIDPDHSAIQFEVSHWGFGFVTGRFDDFTGTFVWDAENPSAAAVTVDIDPTSVSTGTPKLDAHLQNEDFFNAPVHPELSFRSTAYRGDAEGGELDGVLTMHGQDHPVTLTLEKSGEGESAWGDYRVGFRGHTDIDRGDWGMDWRRGKGADQVRINIWVEGIHKP